MIKTISALKSSVEAGETMRVMTEVYSGLSAVRLDRIRVKIERNRFFALQLAQTFHEVKAASLRFKLKRPIKKPLLSVISFSNYGFFMKMETQLVNLFLASNDVSGDLLVVGRSGSEILHNLEYQKPYDILIFGTDLPRPVELAKAAQILTGYEQVAVYYPQFRTMGSQVPTRVDISGDIGEGAAVDDVPFILEPEAPKMLEFFEGQIMRLLLEQTFLEAELSRTAGRLLTMDEAQQRAVGFVKEQHQLLIQAQVAQREKGIVEMSLGYLIRKKYLSA